MPRLAQLWRQFPPNHTAGQGAMHQDERRHSFLPSKNGMLLANVSLEEPVPCLPPLACWSKIGIDRAGGGLRASASPQFSRATNGARNSCNTGDHLACSAPLEEWPRSLSSSK